MAYFDCIVGGSGKGNTLVVTCADDLAGATITCTNGTKTHTKTCPSTAPYEVTFYGLMAGTWTVSATVSGNTYTTTVVVADIEALLGGFNWKTWVDLSENYTSSDFTDLDDLLSDETAVRELMTIHACVDYLADIATTSADVETIIGNDLCAKWINLRDYALDTLYANTIIADYMDEADKYFYGEWALVGQVPKMTSNSAPYGEASASEVDGQYVAYRVFDGDDSTEWSTNHPTNQWVSYTFLQPVAIAEFYILPNQAGITEANGCRVKNYRIEVSDDDFVSDITVVYSGQYLNSNANGDRIKIPNPISKKSIRCYVEDNWTAFVIGIKTLQFYAWQPKGNVPVMTSNSAPYGTASGNSNVTNYEPYRAFNGDASSATNHYASSNNGYLQYKFTNPICPKMIMLYTSRESQYLSNSYKVQGSNDGTNFTDLLTISDPPQTVNTKFTRTIETSDYFLYLRVVFGTSSQGSIQVPECQFYGRELSVSVPTMATNTTPYGEASASSAASGYEAYKTFDGNDSTACSPTSAVTSGTITYKFTKAVCINEVSVLASTIGSGASLKDFDILASNNGTDDWETIESATYSNSATLQTFSFDNSDSYLYWRLSIKNVYGTHWQIKTLQFYGLDYSEKEFEEGSTKKWLYDHGLELETLVTYTSGPAGTITKEPSDILMLCGDSNNKFIGVGCELDTTNYNSLAAKFDLVLKNYADNQTSRGTRVGTISSGAISNVAEGWVVGNINMTNYLDISSVNGVYGVCARVYAETDKLLELWLE